MKRCLIALLGLLCLFPGASRGAEFGEDRYADSDGVKIHYVTAGEGPLVVLLHGFPDYSYTWRDQFPELAKSHQVVALDLRGYNLSDQPAGVENYTMEKLVGDVVAVVRHTGRERATIVGHDWGGAIAWAVAMQKPQLTERLIILNLPHPRGLLRELKNNPAQQANSAYARAFQLPDAAQKISTDALTGWVKEPAAREKYREAFRRSSLEGMLNFYKANYPREPYDDSVEYPQVKCPVLMIHGLDDSALLPGALAGTWNWIDNELTLVTVPKAGHFVHRDKPEVVTRTMVGWLAQHPLP